ATGPSFAHRRADSVQNRSIPGRWTDTRPGHGPIHRGARTKREVTAPESGPVRRGAGRAIRGRGRSSPRWRPVEIEIEIEPIGSMKAEVDRIVRAQEGSGTSVARWIRDTPGGVPWKPSKGLNMRFEKWRGMPLSFTLSAALGLVL